MQDSTPEEINELSETVLEISEELIDEIQAQRDLASAESGDLQIKNTEIQPCSLPGGYSKDCIPIMKLPEGKHIEIEKADVATIFTDRVQLRQSCGEYA